MSFPPTLSAGVPYEVPSTTPGRAWAISRTSSKADKAVLPGAGFSFAPGTLRFLCLAIGRPTIYLRGHVRIVVVQKKNEIYDFLHVTAHEANRMRVRALDRMQVSHNFGRGVILE